MVRLNVVLSPGSARDVDAVMEALRFVMSGTRIEAGCVSCSAWADPDLSVHYAEAWSTEADLHRHVLSPLFTSLLAIVESLPTAPQVQFDFISASRGLDYVAEVRKEPFE